MLEKLEKCEICPHRCRVNRTVNKVGRCKSKDTIKVAKFSLHKYEVVTKFYATTEFDGKPIKKIVESEQRKIKYENKSKKYN